jgi:hypothetical protein
MSVNFKIIDEVEIQYAKVKNSLWVSVICIDNNYFVEVATSYESLGRMQAKNYDVAHKMLIDLNKKLNIFKDIYTAIPILNLGFSMKSPAEMMFVICTALADYTYDEMVEQKTYYRYEIYPPWEYMVMEHEGYAMRIDIFFFGNKRSIGYWKANDEKSKFKFYYNPNYLK